MKSIPATKPEPAAESPNAVGNAASSLTPIEAAIAIREALRVALDGTNQLVISLKQQQKQSRLMKSTLANLKQLQEVA